MSYTVNNTGSARFVGKETAAERFNFCLSCPSEGAFYRDKEEMDLDILGCRYCNCVLQEKVHFADQHCPLNYW